MREELTCSTLLESLSVINFYRLAVCKSITETLCMQYNPLSYLLMHNHMNYRDYQSPNGEHLLDQPLHEHISMFHHHDLHHYQLDNTNLSTDAINGQTVSSRSIRFHEYTHLSAEVFQLLVRHISKLTAHETSIRLAHCVSSHVVC